MIRRLLPFILAAVLGLVSVALVQFYLYQQRRVFESERKKFLAEYQNPIDVVVASHDIPPEKALTAEDVSQSSVPKKFIQPYATSTVQDVVGLITLVPIAQGEQILRTKLRRSDEAPSGGGVKTAGEPLSSLTPEGKRAVTLGMDFLKGVGGFVQPGDTVDILWTFRTPAGEQQTGRKEEEVTIALFQDVTVLAIDQRKIGQPEGPPDEHSGGRRDFNVTVALTPQETSVLAYAREHGRVELSLRSERDKDRQVALNPVSLPRLMEAVLGAQPPSEKAPSEHTVEVYKGTERSVVSVRE